MPRDRLGYFILEMAFKHAHEKGMLHPLWDKLRVSEWCSQDSHPHLTPDVQYFLSQSLGHLYLHNEPMTPGGFFPPTELEKHSEQSETASIYCQELRTAS